MHVVASTNWCAAGASLGGETYDCTPKLVVCHSLILGLAVLALATVVFEKTVANAKTADVSNPNS
jgi:hypothetical protein